MKKLFVAPVLRIEPTLAKLTLGCEAVSGRLCEVN